ncbi:MAG: D-alanyl-D-alanine carboxypeptidase family protein [Fimbriimonadaceae bacterium]
MASALLFGQLTVADAQTRRAAPRARVAPAPTPEPYAPKLDAAGYPDISAKGSIVVDRLTGQVLWAKEPDARLFPASTTKILTALVMVERLRPETPIKAPADIEKITGASLHLKPGEVVSAHDMLQAVLLRSANDACHAVSIHVAGSVEGFAKLMNEKARELGMTNSNFRNAHGLHDPEHYTTARDLAILARAAMQDPTIREIVGRRRAEITRSINQEDRVIVSKNRLIAPDSPFHGIKTGYTRPAGACFVGGASRNGIDIVTVVLGSEDWLADTRFLADWTFDRFARRQLATPGQPVAKIGLPGSNQSLRVGPREPIEALVRKSGGGGFELDAVPAENLPLPIEPGDVVGVVRATGPFGFRAEVPLVALDRVEAPPIAARASVGGWFGWLLAGGLGAAGLAVRRKSRRLSRVPIRG